VKHPHCSLNSSCLPDWSSTLLTSLLTSTDDCLFNYLFSLSAVLLALIPLSMIICLIILPLGMVDCWVLALVLALMPLWMIVSSIILPFGVMVDCWVTVASSRVNNFYLTPSC
jgi:hypothetical protein